MGKYHDRQLVWLREFDNGEEIQPRQQAHIVGEHDAKSDTYCVSLHGVVLELGDDGFREITSDQVEGLVDG
jgi:hypothetical protein